MTLKNDLEYSLGEVQCNIYYEYLKLKFISMRKIIVNYQKKINNEN